MIQLSKHILLYLQLRPKLLRRPNLQKLNFFTKYQQPKYDQ